MSYVLNVIKLWYIKYKIILIKLKIRNEDEDYVQNIPLDHFSVLLGDNIYPLDQKI